MTKLKRKLLSFVMAGVIAVSFSLSAVAEEAFVDEAVTGEAVVIDNGLDIDPVCTEDHEHGYDEVMDVYESITASAGCPHSMIQTGTSSGSERGGSHDLSLNGSMQSCNVTLRFNYTSYICGYSGCVYSATIKTQTGSHHSNPNCP